MTDVIPPATLYSIHPYEQYTREQNNLWKQLFLLLDQLYLRTGGTVDDVGVGTEEAGANENQIAMLRALALQLEERIEELEGEQLNIPIIPKWNSITRTSNYTAAPFDDITAKSKIMVTLPANPHPDDIIRVRNGDGSKITIFGNGKKIRRRDLTDSIRTMRMGTTLEFKYKIDADEYVL